MNKDWYMILIMKPLSRHSFFETGSVVWGVRSHNKFEAIREVINRSLVFRRIEGLDLEMFAERVIEREQLQSTGLGHGVAVAHGRVTQVLEPQIALGVSPEGIDFDAVDDEPVQLLFIIANHPDNKMDYLQILSCLVSLVRNDVFRHELLSCMSTAELEITMCSAFQNLLWKSEAQRA